MDDKDYNFYVLRNLENPGLIYCNHLRSFDPENLGKAMVLEIHGHSYRVIVEKRVTLEESRALWPTVTRLGEEIRNGAIYHTADLQKIVDDTIAAQIKP